MKGAWGLLPCPGRIPSTAVQRKQLCIFPLPSLEHAGCSCNSREKRVEPAWEERLFKMAKAAKETAAECLGHRHPWGPKCWRHKHRLPQVVLSCTAMLPLGVNCVSHTMWCWRTDHPLLLSRVFDLWTHRSQALQRPCAAQQCLWCSISNSCNICKALKMLTFYFSLWKRNIFSLGLVTLLSELILSERNVSCVSVLCYTPGHSAEGRRSSSLPETQGVPDAHVNITKKSIPLLSRPRVLCLLG